MSTDNQQFHEAICQEVVWKNGEMRRFAVELVSRAVDLAWPDGSVQPAVERLDMGRRGSTALPGFTTDIVPSEVRGDGQGIAGSVSELLKNANVIEPVGISQHGKWYPERQRSTRPECKARFLCVHRLKSLAVAQAFLRRNSGVVKEEHFVAQELAI